MTTTTTASELYFQATDHVLTVVPATRASSRIVTNHVVSLRSLNCPSWVASYGAGWNVGDLVEVASVKVSNKNLQAHTEWMLDDVLKYGF